MTSAWAVVIVGVLSFVGTLVGTICGIKESAKMTAYRISQLEERVDKHNNLIERTYKLEEKQSVYDEKFAVMNHRISDLEKGQSA